MIAEALDHAQNVHTEDDKQRLEAARTALGDCEPTPFDLGAVQETLLAGASVKSADGRDRAASRGRTGRSYEAPNTARRTAGAHYTPEALALEVAQKTLDPLLRRCHAPNDVLQLRVCDASMGAGAFLLAAAQVLARALVKLRADSGIDAQRVAMDEVIRTCLFGVDIDPVAVALARIALWIEARDLHDPRLFLTQALRVGNALVGINGALTKNAQIAFNSSSTPPRRSAKRAPTDVQIAEPFHWKDEFYAVFERGGGFDAFVGNPPWVSYAGRAAQPLSEELFDYYHRSYKSFAGYRNLHGLFVERVAHLTRPGGRIGLVVPTSTSDLKGYTPTRATHDELCEVDTTLPDFGNRFADVFQPCMGLLSTRRFESRSNVNGEPWPLERSDIDAASIELLTRLDKLPKVPPELFGERGFQTQTGDVETFGRGDEPWAAGEVGLRAGTDVAPFLRKAPSFRCDPSRYGKRFRSSESFAEVRVLVRQTARVPMACLADGLPFRNSVLAGFEIPGVPPPLLVAYLCSWPVGFFHFMRHRDARQGMPQIKIGHLRSLPLPSGSAADHQALIQMGTHLSERNTGITLDEEEALCTCVSNLWNLSQNERDLVRAWAHARRVVST
ncbi:MAG: hypothetical protein IPK82_28855 [Polyangiaceae bacterium]|nr:hypothetical protein [Polyangiaceae bacterium]